MVIFECILLVGLLLCAFAALFCKRVARAVISFLAFSLIMSILWGLLQSPGLAITELAGVGVSGILYGLTLKGIRERKGQHDA